jgi:putative colanic acid biosynthesis glycosyltransferase WcaI
MLRNRTAIRACEAMERFLYRTADAITVMSDRNGDHVVARGAQREKVHTVANWVDTALIRPADHMNEFRRAHGIGSEFVVLFAGTMGWSQGLGTVIEAARQLATEPNLLFVLVGNGVERPRLERQAAGLPNVRFLPMQSKEVYPQVLAASDACLVTLRPEVATPAVPSKIATIMAAGRAILASLPSGDASQVIEAAQCGRTATAGDAASLADAVLELARQPEFAQQLGVHGRAYAELHLSRTACAGKIEEILRRVTRKPVR